MAGMLQREYFGNVLAGMLQREYFGNVLARMLSKPRKLVLIHKRRQTLWISASAARRRACPNQESSLGLHGHDV